MSVVGAPLSWPELVWDTPILRGLDARARAEIEAAGKMMHLRAGERIFRRGDPADALFVVTSGVCALAALRRGESDLTVIRHAHKGDLIGEEAILGSSSTRQLDARCEGDVTFAEVPVVVLRRAVSRAGGGEVMAKLERALRRAATLDFLRTTSFARDLSSGDLEVLLDAAKHVYVSRGEHVYGEGDIAADAFFVVDGLLQAQTNDDGTPRVEAYLSRGDLFGDEELAQREPRGIAVVASGPTWLVAIPRDVFVVIARRNASELEAARRLRREASVTTGVHTTGHVFRDLYRMRVARSLLVIDQDACVRCGHCAWSCADAHADGVSRLVRRGDKIVVDTTHAASPLLVPNSCQHCKNPSCMIDCPTGAIGRNARGEVFIREDLCTGCGSCAKACPWENIQMAPRKDTKAYAAVAVKCDLCEGQDGGPACVAACPTQAIARIDPNTTLVELRTSSDAPADAGAPILPRRVYAWPWIIGSALAGVGVAGLDVAPWTSGGLAGILLGLLVAYTLAKRLRGPIAKLRGRLPLSRWLYIGHLSVGALACGILAMHVRGRLPSNVPGALTIAIALAVLTGAVAAAMGAIVPRALSRIERTSVLPEELAARPREIDEKVFTTLSGKTELVKTLFVKALRPYRRTMSGPLVLLLSRRTLRDEEKAVWRRIDALTGGKRREALVGLDELVRLVVEHRAVRAQRLLTWMLRGWLVPHLAATTAAVMLLVIHVVAVSWPVARAAIGQPRAALEARSASSERGR